MEKPDILCLSESNIQRSDTDLIEHFSNYNHELNLNSIDINLSRNSTLINKAIDYTRRFDMEDKNVCDIVFEIK